MRSDLHAWDFALLIQKFWIYFTLDIFMLFLIPQVQEMEKLLQKVGEDILPGVSPITFSWEQIFSS